MLKKLLLCLLLCPAPLLAQAHDYVDLEQRLSAAQLHATGLDNLSPAQLALLNQLLRGQAADAQETGNEPPRQEYASGRGASSLVGFNDQPVRSRVKGSVSGWQPGTEFALENGQVWKVLKGSMALRKPFESPEIVVVPGIAGRWFLQVDEDLPKARVYRID